MAGLFSFFEMTDIIAVFACSGQTPQSVDAKVKPTGAGQFVLAVQTPACPEGQANITLVDPSNDESVELNLGTGMQSLHFSFKGTSVSSVTPAEGRTNPGSGGKAVSMFIDNVESEPSKDSIQVVLAGELCTLLASVFTMTNNRLFLRINTPELPVDLAGPAPLTFEISGIVDGRALTAEWRYLPPPPVAVDELRIEGDDQRAWISASASTPTHLTLMLRNLHAKFGRAFDSLRADSLRLVLENAESSTQIDSNTVDTIGDSGLVFASFLLDTSVLTAGAQYNVSVAVNLADESSLKVQVGPGPWLEARDTSQPRLVAAVPHEAGLAGGTLLLAGFLEAASLQTAFAAGDVEFRYLHDGGSPIEVPPPPPRTKWTRRVLHPVLIGHAASFTPY